MPNVGLHIDGDSIHLALIKKSGSRLEIDTHKTISSKDALLSQDIIGKKVEVTTGLAIHDVLIRNFEMPLTKKRALEAALPFQLESQIPYALKDVVSLPQLKTKDGNTTHVHALVCHQKTLKSHLVKLEKLGLSASWVSCHSTALQRYIAHFYPTLNTYIAIHVGYHETSLIAVQTGEIIAATAINIGKKTLENAENNALRAKLKKRMINDLDRSVLFLKNKCKAVLHWDYHTLGYFDEVLKESDVNFLALHDDFKRPDQDHAHYAIAIGLALDTAHQDDKTVQLRQGNDTSATHFANLGKRLCMAFFLASLVALASLLTTNALIKRQEYAFEHSLNAFIKSCGYAGKLQPAEFALGHEKNLRSRINYKLERLKEKLKNQGKTFPVYLDIPSVSQLLYYLSNHPILASEENGIDIMGLDYELESYPNLSALSAPYRARIHLDLSMPSTSAKLLQEAFNEDHKFIDTNSPIDFQRTQTGYKVSFYLKRRRG